MKLDQFHPPPIIAPISLQLILAISWLCGSNTLRFATANTEAFLFTPVLVPLNKSYSRSYCQSYSQSLLLEKTLSHFQNDFKYFNYIL
jgi:hypothetical protein